MTALGAIEVDDLFDKVKTQLQVPAVTNPLGLATDAGKATRIFLPREDPPDPVEGTLWGRIIIVPVTNPFQVISSDDQTLDVAFLTLLEFVPYTAVGWNVARASSAVQQAIYQRLRKWKPNLTNALALTPVTLNRPVQSHPLRDAESRMWYSSAEYTCRVAAKP